MDFKKNPLEHAVDIVVKSLPQTKAGQAVGKTGRFARPWSTSRFAKIGANGAKRPLPWGKRSNETSGGGKGPALVSKQTEE
jgi:hypothetical protein